MPRGRKPSVRYWPTRKAYCCWLDGVQHTLAAGPDDAPAGPTHLVALDRFRRLSAPRPRWRCPRWCSARR